jgi:hypothetical protein
MSLNVPLDFCPANSFITSIPPLLFVPSSPLRTPSLQIPALCFAILLAASVGAQEQWSAVAEGLDLARFKLMEATPVGDSVVTVLRIDPVRWELRALTASGIEEAQPKTAREWCKTYGLVAAVNAGMFNTDRRSHTGYMKCGAHVNNRSVNPYKSLAAFNPLSGKDAPFRIYDLDTTSVSSVSRRYACVIQNLRLIDRARTNRWQKQDNKWSEAALGEDRQGRILFIYCRSPYPMYDFNRFLLSLPIDLVCAQHLEGGPEAQLFLDYGRTTLDLFGNYESGFAEDAWNSGAWPVPNVIGIVKRAQ